MGFLSEHWEILIGGVASILAYIGGKGKRQYESLSAMQEAYDKFVQNWREKYDEVEKDLKRMHSQISDLDHQVHTLHVENEQLKEELNKWKQMYTELKKQFDAHKKNSRAGKTNTVPRLPKNGEKS